VLSRMMKTGPPDEETVSEGIGEGERPPHFRSTPSAFRGLHPRRRGGVFEGGKGKGRRGTIPASSLSRRIAEKGGTYRKGGGEGAASRFSLPRGAARNTREKGNEHTRGGRRYSVRECVPQLLSASKRVHERTS